MENNYENQFVNYDPKDFDDLKTSNDKFNSELDKLKGKIDTMKAFQI